MKFSILLLKIIGLFTDEELFGVNKRLLQISFYKSNTSSATALSKTLHTATFKRMLLSHAMLDSVHCHTATNTTTEGNIEIS